MLERDTYYEQGMRGRGKMAGKAQLPEGSKDSARKPGFAAVSVRIHSIVPVSIESEANGRTRSPA